MHFDTSISLGNLLSAIGFLTLALFAWRDMNWRVKNLEVWRKEHILDEEARDQLIKKMDRVLDHLRWQTEKMAGNKRLGSPPDGEI